MGMFYLCSECPFFDFVNFSTECFCIFIVIKFIPISRNSHHEQITQSEIRSCDSKRNVTDTMFMYDLLNAKWSYSFSGIFIPDWFQYTHSPITKKTTYYVFFFLKTIIIPPHFFPELCHCRTCTTDRIDFFLCRIMYSNRMFVWL